MAFTKDKYKRYGLMGTIVFHALIFLLFIFFGLKTPVPIPQESIVINFGTSNDGMGEIQPENIASSPEQASSNPKTNPEKSSSPAITQNTEDVLSVNKTKNPKETITETPKELEKKIDSRINNAWNKPNNSSDNGESGKSGGEGETGKPGDQGAENGSKNATSHTGYELGNRKALLKTKPTYDCQETGKVVVEIKVDRNGNVIRATPGIQGTTNTKPCLVTKAEEAAMKTKWEADPNAPEFQIGRITYNFVLN